MWARRKLKRMKKMSVSKGRGGPATVRIGANIRARKGLHQASVAIITRRDRQRIALGIIIITGKAPQPVHKIVQDKNMIEQDLPVVAGMRPPTTILGNALRLTHMILNSTLAGVGRSTTRRTIRVGQRAQAIDTRRTERMAQLRE